MISVSCLCVQILTHTYVEIGAFWKHNYMDNFTNFEVWILDILPLSAEYIYIYIYIYIYVT